MPTLAAAEERWRLTIDNAPVGIALVSLTGKFVRVNEALCEFLGYSAEQLGVLQFQDLTHPDDLEADLEVMRALLSGDRQTCRLRKRFLHAEGHALWADVSVAVVFDDHDEPMHFVSHVADLSEEMKAHHQIEAANRALNEQKAQLERSNADLEAFAMLAGHDLQAPLTTIRGYMELLQAEYGDLLDDRANEWVARTGHAAERMSELVSSLLEFSRAGSTTPESHERVCVADLVEKIRVDLDQQISETGASVEVAGDPSLVRAEPARLRQVLQNLIQNSIKYRSPDRKPRCVVAVRERTTDWLVTVTDNAVGIPAEHRESVFFMFTRVDSAVSGHGIGLAACRRIVERHGGRIWVEENPSGGSRFCFTLPR